METVYVVEGSTGEYSDRSEWPVRAFASETKAAEFVKRLEDKARSLGVHMENDHVAVARYGSVADAIKAAMAEAGDPNFYFDYTGTRYGYYSVELDPSR